MDQDSSNNQGNSQHGKSKNQSRKDFTESQVDQDDQSYEDETNNQFSDQRTDPRNQKTHDEDSELHAESNDQLETQKLDDHNNISGPNQDAELDDSEPQDDDYEEEGDEYSETRGDPTSNGNPPTSNGQDGKTHTENPVDDSQYNTGDSQTNYQGTMGKTDGPTTEYTESQQYQPRKDSGDDTESPQNQSNTQFDSSKYGTEQDGGTKKKIDEDIEDIDENALDDDWD